MQDLWDPHIGKIIISNRKQQNIWKLIDWTAVFLLEILVHWLQMKTFFFLYQFKMPNTASKHKKSNVEQNIIQNLLNSSCLWICLVYISESDKNVSELKKNCKTLLY